MYFLSNVQGIHKAVCNQFAWESSRTCKEFSRNAQETDEARAKCRKRTRKAQGCAEIRKEPARNSERARSMEGYAINVQGYTGIHRNMSSVQQHYAKNTKMYKDMQE